MFIEGFHVSVFRLSPPLPFTHSRMENRRADFVQWLAFFGAAVGLSCPDDHSEPALRHFYHQLALQLHPDRLAGTDARTSDRTSYLFKLLSDVCDTYFNTDSKLPDPPNDGKATPFGHDGDSAPSTGRARHGRRVYLVTFPHPQTDGRRAPADFSREQFGKLILRAFEDSIPSLKVEYLAVFRERHASGATLAEREIHYHVSVKSNRQHRWEPIARQVALASRGSEYSVHPRGHEVQII